MKKANIKRILALLMAGTMVFSLASCGEKTDDDKSGDTSSGGNTNEQKDDPNMDGDLQLNEPGKLPLVDGEPVTFSAFISPQMDTCTEFDRDSNIGTKYIEDKLNVRFDFYVASKADKTSKLNLIFTSDDYPDIIFGSGWDGAALYSYGKDKYLLPLTDYFENDAYYFNKYLDVAEEVNDGTVTDSIKKSTIMPNGEIYSLYRYKASVHTKYVNRAWINSDWLDTVGMDIPKTTDELYDVLTAFKEKDPNGNGKKDEVPLAGSIKGWASNPRMFLMNSFCYYPGLTQFHSYVDDGEVIFAPTLDGYREGLEYLHKLTEDGLLATESWTQETAMLKALSSQDQLGMSFNGGHDYTVITNGKEGDWTKWVTVDPLKGSSGVQYAHFQPSNPISGFQITDNCKYPKLAFRVGDAFYDNEISHNLMLGQLGKYWDYADEDMVGLDGEPAKMIKLIGPTAATEPNYCWGQSTHASDLAGWHTGMAVKADPSVNSESMYYNAAVSYSKYKPDDDMILPALVFEEDVATQVIDLRTDLHSYLEEADVDFILKGVTDKIWEAFQKELKARGVEKLVKAYQDAYDAIA